MVVGKCTIHEHARDRGRMGTAFGEPFRMACADRTRQRRSMERRRSIDNGELHKDIDTQGYDGELGEQ